MAWRAIDYNVCAPFSLPSSLGSIDVLEAFQSIADKTFLIVKKDYDWASENRKIWVVEMDYD